MAAGDQYRRIEPSDMLVFDDENNLVGMRSGKSDSAEMRLGAPMTAAQVQAVQSQVDRHYPCAHYADVSQAQEWTTASMTAGSAVLSVTGYTFGDQDIGKTVGVLGAGVVSGDYTVVANDGVLAATISSVTGGMAVLSVAATNTVAGASCVFGFPIDDALSLAVAACEAAYAVDGVSGTVVFPPGRYIAVEPQPISSGVSLRGAGMDSTAIYVVKIVADASNATTAPWIRRNASYASVGRYDQVNVSELTLIGTYYASSGAYGADTKMIHMSHTSNSKVWRVRIVDNPSTAVGYDESINCLVAENIILNPGRLATPTSSHGSAGGSGIGVAIGSISDVSMNIRNNYIKGKWTSSGGTGRNGINIEAASGIADPPTYYGGVLIEGNFVEGFFNGIVDSGAIGTIVRGNTVRRCTHGIKAGTNGVSVGRIARDMAIVGNRVADLFTVSPANNSIGIAATTTSATKDSAGRILIADNIVTGVAGGYGVQLLGQPSYPLRNVTVRNNHIMDSDLSGIRVYGNVYGLVIAGNQISGNGRTGGGSNNYPIKVESTVVWTDGRLDSNTYTDYQSVPTQAATHNVHGSAVLTNVTIVA